MPDVALLKSMAVDRQSGEMILAIEVMQGTITISSWKNGLTICQSESPGEKWERLNVQLIHTDQANVPLRFQKALVQFTGCFPEEIRRLVAPIAHGQLQALQILRQTGEAGLELAKDSITLLWILAYNLLTKAVTLEQATVLVRGKRHEIVKLLSPGSTMAHVRLISKIVPQEFSRAELRTLHGIAKATHLPQTLRHVPQLVLGKLGIALEFPEMLDIPCIQRELSDVSGSVYSFRMARTLAETCHHLAREAELVNVNHLLASCQSVDDLIKLTEEWQERYNSYRNRQLAVLIREQEAVDTHNQKVKEARLLAQRQRRAARKNLKFPLPPLAGNKYIMPITTYDELKKEGRRMNNCVATYKNAIVAGTSYIYKIFYPERCTLELKIGKTILLGELKKKDNVSPHKQVRTFLMNWLTKEQEFRK